MENIEILSNLKILGLEAGATVNDIHTAFRKLARELHPDITGAKSDYKFKKITSAYTALKNITDEELTELENFIKKIQPDKPKLKRDIYDYYSVEKKRRADDKIIDDILNKYEEELKSFNKGKITESDLDMEAVILRLKSKNPKVINVVLKNAGALACRVEFRLALVEVLKRLETISDELAEIIGSLPFDESAKKLIAIDASNYAEKFPTGLIISLIGSDADVMENFLLHSRPDDASVILRRWPAGKAMNNSVIRKLLENNDPRILVPLLGAMKTHFPSSAKEHTKRLWELERHSNAAVRAWAKKLT